MAILQNPSKVMCKGVKEIKIPSHLIALPQHYKRF